MNIVLKRLHYVISAASLIVLSNITWAQYDAHITAARQFVNDHCSGISSSGTGETSTHSDVALNGNRFCECYDKIWDARNEYPFNEVQVIYHEKESCNWPHLHFEHKSSALKMDVDESDNSDGQCYNDENSSTVDKWAGKPERRGACTDSNLILIQAESYNSKSGKWYNGKYVQWDFRNWTGKPGWTGTGAMQAMPKDPHVNQDYVHDNPRMTYQLDDLEQGTYYVWVRGWGNNGQEDSVHVRALRDSWAGQQSDRMSYCWHQPGWKWCDKTMDGNRARFHSPWAGPDNFSVYMRENGFRIDKIVLTKNPILVPDQY